MALPVVPVTQPESIAKVATANIIPSVHGVRKFFPGVGYSWLHPAAARSWDALTAACLAETGVRLTAVSTADVYRSYAVQVAAFRARYVPKWTLAACGLKNKVENRRTWDGITYYLLKGQIPCAVPGKGWHPRLLAVDVAVYDPNYIDGNKWEGGARAVRGNALAWEWLKKNVISFGWSWEIPSEGVDDPHLHYWAGDKIQKRVLDVEAWFGGVGG